MKKALLKAVFGFSVLILWLILMIPAMAGVEYLFPVRRRPDGLYPSVNSMPLVMISMIPRIAGQLGYFEVFPCHATIGRTLDRLQQEAYLTLWLGRVEATGNQEYREAQPYFSAI